MIQLTHLAKTGGPLTKRISLAPDGSLRSDGSECIMRKGTAKRVVCATLHEFAAGISEYCSHEAVALGALRSDLPDEVRIITKSRLEKLNSSAANNVIARTSDHILYRAGQPALALIDIDTKGMPATVRDRIKDQGGYWAALASVVPELEHTARVERHSTTTGISRADTGEQLPGSDGEHIFPLVQDGADIERFLRTLHDRCWLAGFGWFMVGIGGQLLERSIVDRMVYAPERLVFEGAPVLDPPLLQDLASRKATVTDGAPLDTVAACPPLTIVEQAKLHDLRAKNVYCLAPGRAKARDQFIREQTARILKRTGCTVNAARRTVERQCDGALLSDVVLPFDDADLAGCTVNDVLADPDRFVGATLADPLEGVEYGVCKAKVMQRPDGTLWVHSFAHGRTVYDLKYDADAIAAFIAKAADAEAIDVLARLVATADVSDHDLDQLVDTLVQRVKVGKMIIKRAVTNARKGQARQRHQADQDRHAAERTDPRPRIAAPHHDAPWLPAMEVLNDVHGASTADEPPMRDLEGVYTAVHVRRVPNMHALTADGANQEEAKNSRLPAPEQPLLTRLTETELAEVIERHIDYFDPKELRSVHLAGPFVKHFLKRSDNVLPLVRAIVTVPIVSQNGTLLGGVRGLDRQRGIIFRIPPELMRYIPTIEDCHEYAVIDALDFLMNVWLVDVAAEYVGKCLLIAAALTLIQRSLLPERPGFFVTAGQRGGGKTTTLIMLLMAITGLRPSAAAWSPHDEERRKALLSYLMEGVPAIVWDNIPRGARISCPHIERACTIEDYSDRRLGVNEVITVPAYTVNFFTGNNIAPRGDLASRAPTIRLEVERADPENRPFMHPDPVAWTEANRGKILNALFILLLARRAPRSAGTRFKMWDRLVGSAVEHAVELSGGSLNFKTVFLSQEADDEESASLGDALAALNAKWPNEASFAASEVANIVNNKDGMYASDADVQASQVLREVLYPKAPRDLVATGIGVGKLLRRHIGEPVRRDGVTLILKDRPSTGRAKYGTKDYYVQARDHDIF